MRVPRRGHEVLQPAAQPPQQRLKPTRVVSVCASAAALLPLLLLFLLILLFVVLILQPLLPLVLVLLVLVRGPGKKMVAAS